MIRSIATLSVLSALFHFAPTHTAPVTATDVPPPKGGLESNSNYIFVNQNTENIQDLKATISVTEDLIVSSTGVAFQLDCWAPSPKSSSDLAFQEFGIFFDGSDIGGFIVTSTLSDFKKSTSKLNRRFVLENTTLSSDDTNKDIIPAGTTFTITLINDENGKITDAQFGLTKGETGDDINRGITIPGVTASVVGFTLVITGLGHGVKGQFTGGNGTVEYTASTSFSPLNALPNGFLVEQTASTGNSVYGELSGSQITDLRQTWGVSS
jgi:hypothetical protein